jgi:hypothetical protein
MPEHHAKREVVISQKVNKTLQSGEKHIHQYTITWSVGYIILCMYMSECVCVVNCELFM